MPSPFVILILYALFLVGAITAVVLAIGALRRIAKSHEKSAALLEELVQQQTSQSTNPIEQKAHSGTPKSSGT
jgi:hypothetical protein